MKRRLCAPIDADSLSAFGCFLRRLCIIGAALLLGALPARGASFESALQTQIQALPQQGDAGREGAIAAPNLITQYYLAHAYQPVWTDERKRNALRALIRDSKSHGLDPEDYHAALLDRSVGETPEDLARREILYTDALIRLAYHMRFGKVNPHEIYAEWNYRRSLSDVNAPQALEAVLKEPDLALAVEAFGPRIPHYNALRHALAQHYAIGNAGGWPKIADGPTIKPGMSDARLPVLRARLQASGDLQSTEAADPNLYDESVQQAMARFQARHGMEKDVAIGKQTLAALNVPVEKRIDQIRVNLERIRWVAHGLPSEFLLVDLAGFDATLYRDGRIVWFSRAMVGKPYRKTPVFRAEMTHVVLNPNWTVPPTILKQDVLPKSKNDPDYLAKKGMRLLDESGKPAAGGWRPGLRVVQPPGPENPLGQYKFDMPNPHAIYLHDTPSKEKFSLEARAFSSGCIRLEKPDELALLLLSEQHQWTKQQMDDVVATDNTKFIALKQKIPVLILYFTAEVRDKEVRFRPDIYERDARLIAALKEPFRVSRKTN
jgi:L,D-transpeptidase YcbB